MGALRWLLVPAAVVGLLALGFGGYRLFADPASRPEVVVYVSADQEIASPILQSFESRTGIRVDAVYDTEATKTAGLAARILHEREHPRADVFWASEPSRMARMAAEGLLAPYTPREADGLPDWARRPLWTAFSSRERVLLVNLKAIGDRPLPDRLEDLLLPAWRGQVALADPRYGTTSAQAAALTLLWGPERATAFAKGLREQGARVCAGNAMVREMVERGEAALGWTDSDDAWAAIDRGAPVRIHRIEPGLCIPNAAALIAGAPHPEPGRLLIDFLVSAEVEHRLASPPVRQPPLRGGQAPAVDWEALGALVEKASGDFHRALTRP